MSFIAGQLTFYALKDEGKKSKQEEDVLVLLNFIDLAGRKHPPAESMEKLA